MKAENKYLSQMTALIAQLNEKNPYYLLVGVLVLILIVDYLLVMQFQLRSLSSLNPKISTLSEELTTTKNNIERMSQYQTEIGRLNDLLDRFNTRVKSKEEIPRILENISLLANKNGVKIEQIMPNMTLDDPVLKSKEGEYYVVPVIIEAKAAYHNFGRFLSQMEEEGVFMGIGSFSVAANPRDPQAHMIKLTVDTVVLETAKR